jgi:hypothetical protein
MNVRADMNHPMKRSDPGAYALLLTAAAVLHVNVLSALMGLL